MASAMMARPAVRPVASRIGSFRRLPAPVQASRPSVRSVAVRAALSEGDRLTDYPDYFRKLKNSKGGMTSLSEFQGKKPLVVFFYPKAETPGCTKEACKFRDEYQAFQSLGAEVVGISGDTVQAQEAFASKHSLPFTILADEANALRKGFGVPSDMFGFLPGRQTYVISKEGKVVLVFNSQLDVEAHVERAMAALRKLQTAKSS